MGADNDHAAKYRNDPRLTDELLGLAHAKDADRDNEGYCQTIGAMIACSSDQDSEVRNWATFGLGSQIDTDTPAIREALFARLEEEDDEIRGEAFVGLARRGDIRVVTALLKELDT